MIDDDETVRSLIARRLHKESVEVIEARIVTEGLRLARDIRPAMITLDVVLPDLDGWDVLAALKADRSLTDVPVIMTTVVDEETKAFALGAADYLRKPIDVASLRRVVKRYATSGEAKRALIVEGNEITRRMIETLLHADGWVVSEGRDGRDGLDRLAELEVRPDVILHDLTMPEVDGFQFLDKLRENPDWKDIPVVAITAKDLSGEDQNRLNGGVAGIMQRGVDSREAFLANISSWLAQALPEERRAHLPQAQDKDEPGEKGASAA